MYEPVLIEQEHDEDLELDKKLAKLGGIQRKTALEIGFYGRKAKERKIWFKCGIESEDQYRASRVGVSRSTWYEVIRLAEGLKRLTLEELLRISQQNCSRLLALPETLRYDGEWLDKAETMTEETFALAVEESIDAHHNIPEEERRVWFKLKMYKTQREVIEAILKEFAADEGLGDDLGRALELILADWKS